MPKVDGQWTSSWSGCTDDLINCCFTIICPCVTFGRTAHMVTRGDSSCRGTGSIYCLLGVVGWAWLYSCSYRTKLRSMFGLPEEPCGDCCVHLCCHPCALCQEHRELLHRGYDPSAGWNGAMNAPAGIPGMVRL